MLARVLETISRYNMLPAGARVIVAVSGGADSVSLLHILHDLVPQSLAGVAHFNHKWRAEASDEDERFVADLAARFSLPFFRAEAPPGPSTGNLEQNARRARYAFFSTLGATMALGHTRDDQAETVLFRFLRGSGLAGLAGIAPLSNGIIRPLIETTRAEVEEFLRSRNIPWRDDASNLDPRFARNRIRHHLLPQLARDWNPQIHESLARVADLAREEEIYWNVEIDRLAASELKATSGQPGAELRASALTTLPRASARRLIRRAIQLAKGDLRQIDFDHIEAVFKLQRRLRLPGVTVTKSFDWILFTASTTPTLAEPVVITPPGTWPSPDGLSQICVDVAHIRENLYPPPSNACATLKVEACWCQIRSPLVLRGWRPGDHYRPAGKSRDQKIQEMFQKARIPSWRRASWPILTNGNKILWSRQFGVAREFAVSGENRALLRIRELI
jgi:tRNA(Ile)-lysidine synthase